jgi:hypothetical protein
VNERDFVYWLNGFLELSGVTSMDPEQLAVVREHLALVLRKKTVTSVAVRPSSSPPAVNSPFTHKPFFGGVACGVCGRLCSNEGGVCRACLQGVITGDARCHTGPAVGATPPSPDPGTLDALKPLCAPSPHAGAGAPTLAEPEVLDVPLHLTC